MRSIINKLTWPEVLVILVSGGLSAWLTLDATSTAAIFGFVGPLIAAAAVIGIFGLLAFSLFGLLVSLSR